MSPDRKYFSSPDTNAPFVHVNWYEYEEETFIDVNDYVGQITKVEAT